MDQSLKQRLVGAIVLISLAVIFMPLVFDGQQARIDTQEYAIPEKPIIVMKSVDFEPVKEAASTIDASIIDIDELKAASALASTQQEQVEAVAEHPETKATVEAYVAEEKVIDQQIQSAPKTEPVDLADAWIIQVGAFSSAENAQKLRDTLIKDGYSAYLQKVDGLNKLYVGPEIRKYRLEQQKTDLENKYKLKVLILKYIP